MKRYQNYNAVKSARPAGFPQEDFKTGGGFLKDMFLGMYWDDGSLPQDIKDAHIVHLYKGKGDKSSCDNSIKKTVLVSTC